MADNPGKSITYEFISLVMSVHGRYCDEVMTNKHNVETIKQKQFDLAVVDGLLEHIYMFMSLSFEFEQAFIGTNVSKEK